MQRASYTFSVATAPAREYEVGNPSQREVTEVSGVKTAYRPAIVAAGIGALLCAAPVAAQQCGGTERWAVKVGSDPDLPPKKSSA